MTLSELIARDKSVSFKGDPAASYIEYSIGTTSEKVRVYYSQPICLLSEGESFAFDTVTVKIADFGKGLTDCTPLKVATTLDEDSEVRRLNGFGDRCIVAPEVLVGDTWDCMANVWSLGASVVQPLPCARC